MDNIATWPDFHPHDLPRRACECQNFKTFLCLSQSLSCLSQRIFREGQLCESSFFFTFCRARRRWQFVEGMIFKVDVVTFQFPIESRSRSLVSFENISVCWTCLPLSWDQPHRETQRFWEEEKKPEKALVFEFISLNFCSSQGRLWKFRLCTTFEIMDVKKI